MTDLLQSLQEASCGSRDVSKFSGTRRKPDVFDELKCRAERVHIERMSDGHIWMAIMLPDGECISLNFVTRLFSGRLSVNDWELEAARLLKASDARQDDGGRT